jgi:2-dehydro-3-deoxy-L-fuconate 4-dehydrogenase
VTNNTHGRLSGKRCLITAAGAGIGRDTTLTFAKEGALVLATDIDAEALQSLAGGHPAIRTAVLDVTDPAQVASIIESNPHIDVLFNCAGYVHAGTILDTSLADWRRSFAVNVDSMFHLCKAVLPGMLARGHGNIINMSSVASSIKGVAQRFAYGATKAAVVGLTKAIAADYVARGVRCNAICAGTVKTPSLARRVAALGADETTAWKTFTDRQPMGRLGVAKEIAALALYLAADESAFTTGAIHVIDGGWSN